MEFFDKKEEVIDLQLTQYGKYLLSLGKLKPVYYAFGDGYVTTARPSDIADALRAETRKFYALDKNYLWQLAW